jgi:hypothetical protein
MSDELEQLLGRVPDRVPPASPEVSARVRDRVLQTFRPNSPRRTLLVAAVLVLVAAACFGAGRLASPTHAASDVTIGVRPDVVDTQNGTPVTLFGTVPSGRPGESVQVEANECGLSGLFHELQGLRTEGQGVWSMPIPGNYPQSKVLDYIRTKTQYRARWNGHTSETVTVYARPYLELRQFTVKKKRPGQRNFGISVGGRQMKYRKKIAIERRVATNVWRPVKTVVVNGGLALFWARVTKGQTVRARLPESEAAPCYLAAVTPPWTVR